MNENKNHSKDLMLFLIYGMYNIHDTYWYFNFLDARVRKSIYLWFSDKNIYTRWINHFAKHDDKFDNTLITTLNWQKEMTLWNTRINMYGAVSYFCYDTSYFWSYFYNAEHTVIWTVNLWTYRNWQWNERFIERSVACEMWRY